ncbi:MAG TPA: ABC transporter permease [Bryobacteraceae bacterium]|jgi:predicted permease
MGAIAQDVRYSLRMLARTPVATVVAVVSLALGIGANTAIFSLMNALLLRSLPIRDAGQLVSLMTTTAPQDPDSDEGFSLAMFNRLKSEQRVFTDVFSWGGDGVENLEANGAKYVGTVSTVSGEYFPSIGIRPFLGRFIGPDDLSLETGSPAAVAVIGYGCWQRRYNGDPRVLGKTIRVRNRPLTIIGVTPKNFTSLYIDGDTDVTVPVGFSGNPVYRDRKRLGFELYAHLKSGVTIEQARTQLDSIWPGILEASMPEAIAGPPRDTFLAHRLKIAPAAKGESFLRRRFARPLNVLMAMVGMLLLIACVNLANLMLARAAGRGHEFGIRLALGAARWRLVRQTLVESLILSLTGAALGLFVAFQASRLIAGMMWAGLVPLGLEASPDLRVLALTALVAALTGVAFGMSPAWGIFATDAAGALRQNSRSVRGGSNRLGKLLIIAQVALSIVLVIGAVLFVRSLDKLRASDVGYRRDGLVTLLLFPQADPNGPKMPNRTSYYYDLATRVEQLPGVESASFSIMGPMSTIEFTEPTSLSADRQQPAVAAVGETVGPGFFHTAGMHLLAGRDFEWRDDEAARKVGIISESLARRLFPAGDAIGKTIDSGGAKGLEIVGVVNSASLWTGRTHEPMAVYTPLTQVPRDNSPSLVLRTNGTAALPDVRRVIESMGRHIAIQTETMEQRLDRVLTTDRIIALLSTFFGALALLLASIGLYGLMSYAVERRTSEIGVRMALGAQQANVRTLILKDVLGLVLAGLAIGIPAAWAASRLVSGMIFGIAVDDPLTVVVASTILIAVAALAGYLPARRASLIDPIAALRAE